MPLICISLAVLAQYLVEVIYSMYNGLEIPKGFRLLYQVTRLRPLLSQSLPAVSCIIVHAPTCRGAWAVPSLLSLVQLQINGKQSVVEHCGPEHDREPSALEIKDWGARNGIHTQLLQTYSCNKIVWRRGLLHMHYSVSFHTYTVVRLQLMA